jgi:hypothetical protein
MPELFVIRLNYLRNLLVKTNPVSMELQMTACNIAELLTTIR